MNYLEYSEDFRWDYSLHFPVPTIDYIRKRTGEDMLIEFATTIEAEGRVLAIVRTAKNYLFAERKDMLAWEYDIANNIKLIYEVLEYILEFINFAFITGNYADLYDLMGGKKKSPAIENAKNNLLGATKILIDKSKIREGY